MNEQSTLSRVRVVLSHTTHPGNIGAVARAMKTMGMWALCLVEPKVFPDAQASARAAGGLDVLDNAKVCQTLAQALKGCVLAVAMTARHRDLSPPAATIREAAARLIEAARNDEVALVFGTENSGLTTEEVAHCQMVVHIPANPAYASLNLACAAQVMCYELFMAAAAMPPSRESPSLAKIEDVERFFAALEKALIDIEFLNPLAPKRLMPRLRRLFAKAEVDKEELNILMGMLSSHAASRAKLRGEHV
ncbi:MAG: RNA methyltransferase [Burkholderiales bacterium]